MNKKELIERIEGLKNLFGNKAEYIEIDAAIELISELDEPEKVKVPQFVADWYEENKDVFEANLYRCAYNIPSVFDGAKLNEFERWFLTAGTKPFQTLVNMHQFGYEVEKEKRYIIKLKGVPDGAKFLKYAKVTQEWYFGMRRHYSDIEVIHTRKELEDAGFGEVFNSPLFEVEEVE